MLLLSNDLMAFCWTFFSLSTPVVYWKAPNWMQYSCKSQILQEPKRGGKIISPRFLLLLLLIQLRMHLAFFGSRTHYWCMFSYLTSRTPKSFPECWKFIQDLIHLSHAHLFACEFETCRASMTPLHFEQPSNSYSRKSDPTFLQSLFASRIKKTERSHAMKTKIGIKPTKATFHL